MQISPAWRLKSFFCTKTVVQIFECFLFSRLALKLFLFVFVMSSIYDSCPFQESTVLKRDKKLIEKHFSKSQTCWTKAINNVCRGRLENA